MSESNPPGAKATSIKSKRNKKFIRMLKIANARYFENGEVISFDTYRSPYAARKKRGKTSD